MLGYPLAYFEDRCTGYSPMHVLQLETISSDAIPEEKLDLVYTARIRLERLQIDRDDSTVPLVPGMPVLGGLRTDWRSIIRYLTDSINEALRNAASEDELK